MDTLQYTFRNIPKDIDIMLRKRSLREGKSFNKTGIEVLRKGLMGSISSKPETIFDEIRGSNLLDKGFDDAIEDMSRIDPKMWE